MPEPPPIQRPAECDSCGKPVGADGWCYHCARRRQMVWEIGLIVLSPVLSFGACVYGMTLNNPEISNQLFFLSLGVFVLGPGLGVALVITNAVMNARRKR